MKKVIALLGLGLSGLTAYAGTMGAVSATPWATPYFGGEALYSWNSIHGYSINNNLPSVSKSGWGGRLSAGINHPYTEKVSLNAEIGGGYYGSTQANVGASGIFGHFNITGYDFLVGAAYHFQSFDLFGNIGFMAQTLFASMLRDQAKQFIGGGISGVMRSHDSATEVLPEFRVGGLYNLTNNVALTLAYTYVVGLNVSGDIHTSSATAPPSFFSSYGASNARNPALSNVLFGLRYNFV